MTKSLNIVESQTNIIERLPFLIITIAIYFFSAQFNFLLGAELYYGWPIWLPAGIFLAILINKDEHVLPYLALGHFLAISVYFYYNGLDYNIHFIIFAFIVASIETIELYFGKILIKKFIGNQIFYNHSVDFVKFFGIIVAISGIGAIVVALMSAPNLGYKFSVISVIWLKWFLGHVTSMILITPLILYWRTTKIKRWSFPKFLEFSTLLVCIFSATWYTFSNNNLDLVVFFSPYFIIPFLVWTIIRFSNRILFYLLVLIASITIYFTINNLGPFQNETKEMAQVLAQGFIFSLVTFSMLLYAAISELRIARNKLDSYRNELELLVDEKSQEVKSKNKILQKEIEERSKTEKKLRELSLAVEQSPASVIITDKNGNIEYANPKFLEMKQYSFEEIAGENPKIFSSGKHDKSFFSNMWKTILKGEIWKGEILNKKKNGDLFWELALISPLIDEEGNIVRLLAIYEDITKQKESEEKIQNYIKQLSESEERLIELNLNKDRFFTIIAHDLKSPFTSLLGFSEFLVNDFEELTLLEIKEYSSNIYDASKSAYKLLENLLQWSRLQRNKIQIDFEEVDLLTTVQTIIDDVSIDADKKGISIEINESTNLKVYADENTLSTVLRNLITNAIKFCNNGDSINIFVDYNENFFYINVADTGIGMSDEDLIKLFRIDVHHSSTGTANEKGTGLGLIMCKELVDKNNGTILVESELEKGTTFTIKLPTSNKELIK